MRNLINFIKKHHFFFIFLALQTIAFIMMVQSNHYHRSIWVNSANKLTGQLYKNYANIEEYFYLKNINKKLIQENKALIEQTPYSFLKTDQQTFHINDTIYKRQYTYINADIINNSVNRRNNYITINKGSLHGVERDMGVITPMGVIGIVKDVSPNFSSVISLLHMDTRISAKIKKNGHLGTILWDAPNYRKVTMKHIPLHVEVQTGDTIITSGYSKIFPEGINIGTISDYKIRRGENFLTIKVELFEDFNKVRNVHVVNNIYRQEQKELEVRSTTQPVFW